MAELSWVATEALTGEIIADLPGLDVPSVKSTLGRYESATADLPLPTAPRNWQRATLPGATNLLLLFQQVDNRGNHVGEAVPIWGGMITQLPLTESDTVSFPMATLESYLDRRYVGDEEYVQVGQNDIIEDLVDKYVRNGPNGGIPIRVQRVTPGPGKLRDKSYADQADKTIYSVLSDLMGLRDGPEWTIGWEHQSNPERYTPVLYVGDRIGTPVPEGLGPAATFEIPGPVDRFQRMGDYSNGKGANTVMATSSADGDTRPQSDLQVVPDLVRPTFEHRWSPSTSITELDTLNDYARSAVVALAEGTKSLTLSAAADRGPQLGIDWFIGDDIGYSIGGRIDGRETVPACPGGLKGVARAYGWELALNGTPIITPTLVGATI